MRILGALLRSAHPVPALGVTAIAVLLGVAVGLEAWRVVVLGIAVGLDQLSVGLSNDWIDADRDRIAGRRDKPVAVGEIGVGVVRAVAVAAAALSLLTTLPLGLAATGVHALLLGAAWGYNAVLKGTVLSAVPYLVAFGLLPALATLSRPEPTVPAWWAIGAGAALGLAAHAANVLPDLDDDRRTGIRGLPHRVGRRGALALAGIALLAATAFLSIGLAPAGAWAWAGLAASLVLSGTAVGLGLARPASRIPFRLVLLAALVDVALLVLAGGRLVA